MGSALNWVWTDPVVSGPTLAASSQFQNYLIRAQSLIAAMSSSTLNMTAFGNGANALQSAINQAIANGGGTVFIPAGTWAITPVVIPVGVAPVVLLGQGNATVIIPASPPVAGFGLIDVSGSNVTITNLLIDGGVTVSVGLFYNQSFSTSLGPNDPMAPALTQGTSVWVHGGVSGFTMFQATIQHTAGYGVLLDARLAGITDVDILFCKLTNNRPHLFGTPGGQAIFGSWTGGIFLSGDGRNAGAGQSVQRFQATGNRFTRGTGNQVWSHLYGLADMHTGFNAESNFFEDIGLDGIEVAGVIGGSVSDNDLHRIGYISTSDTDQAVPRWLSNANATAIDSAGLVIGVNYQGNSIISPNGGALDLDGHCDSSLSGNTVRIPLLGDPDYTADQIEFTGANNNGSTSYGINVSNSANSAQGGSRVGITGNTFLNLPAGSVRLYSARNCLVAANIISAPNVTVAPPIAFGPIGSGPNQRATGNIIKHNHCVYNPGTVAPLVFEDGSISPFVATDQNFVFGNNPILPAGSLGYEFKKDPNSGSPVYSTQVWP
jgi:hypothetical protein